VVTAPNGVEGLARLYESYPNLVILAEELPWVNAMKLCVQLQQAYAVPLIAVGDDAEASLPLLEAGADVFMDRPLRLAELVARVRSILRRRKVPNRQSSSGDHGGSAHIFHKRRFGRGNGDKSDLSPTEFRLLSCLSLNEGRVVPREQLIAEVWAGKHVGQDSLRFYVRRLRRKLAGGFATLGHIANCRGVGYRYLRTAGNR